MTEILQQSPSIYSVCLGNGMFLNHWATRSSQSPCLHKLTFLDHQDLIITWITQKTENLLRVNILHQLNLVCSFIVSVKTMISHYLVARL